MKSKIYRDSHAGKRSSREPAELDVSLITVDGAEGKVAFTANELEIPVRPGARLTVCTPADEQTRERLPLTRRAR